MTELKNSLQIVQFEARNVTNLKAIRITPDKKMVVLTGKNEAGKSNILDVIQSMLEGLKLRVPIREGQERADASIDLGEIKIKKRWTPKGEGLEVYRMVDGKKQTYSSPQTFLNELTGKMVDPMKLYNLMKNDPKKFRDTLAQIVGLDLTDLAAEEQKVRDERKLVNDKIRDAVAQLKNMTAPDPSVPDEEMTFKTELDKVNRLREKQKKFKEVEWEKHQSKNIINDRKEVIESQLAQIEELRRRISENEEIIKKEESRAFEIVEAITDEQISAAEADIEKVEQKNVEIRNAIRYRNRVKESQKFQKDSDALTQKIERIEQDKQTRIANCKFPVDGLSLTEDTVVYEGKPVDVASSGRQIRIFTKMAMAMSPNVRVLLIRDGSFLDSQGFGEICKIADEEGFQIWMEKVDESGQVGVFIENGEIKKVDGQEVQQPSQEQEVADENLNQANVA